MSKSDERRVRSALRKADGRKKGLLLANNIADECLRGTPLLTESEIGDIMKDIKSNAIQDSAGNFTVGDESRECAALLNIMHNLSCCLFDVQTEFLDAKAELASLAGLFSVVREYQNFNELLNELCLIRNGKFNARLQKNIVSTGQLFPYRYNMSLTEHNFDEVLIDLRVPDAGAAAISEVVERVKQKTSCLKALIQAMRHLMNEKQVPISVLIESIDGFKQDMRSRIRLTKSLLFNTESTGWEETRARLLQRADPKLVMMEALPDYDDLPVDEATYDETRSLLNRKFPQTISL